MMLQQSMKNCDEEHKRFFKMIAQPWLTQKHSLYPSIKEQREMGMSIDDRHSIVARKGLLEELLKELENLI